MFTENPNLINYDKYTGAFIVKKLLHHYVKFEIFDNLDLLKRYETYHITDIVLHDTRGTTFTSSTDNAYFDKNDNFIVFIRSSVVHELLSQEHSGFYKLSLVEGSPTIFFNKLTFYI